MSFSILDVLESTELFNIFKLSYQWKLQLFPLLSRQTSEVSDSLLAFWSNKIFQAF